MSWLDNDLTDAYGFPLRVGALPREVKAVVRRMRAAVRPRRYENGDIYYPRPPRGQRHRTVTVYRRRWGHARRFEVTIDDGFMEVVVTRA